MLTVIGCGNINRSDDGIGAIVARKLQEFLAANPHPRVRVFDCGTAGMEVMFQARGTQQLIVVDASSTGSEPGAIFKVPGSELEALPEPSYSLHEFRWEAALAVGRKIFKDDFPTEAIVYLIEAENLGFGWELSPVVRQAGDRVVAEIIELIDNC